MNVVVTSELMALVAKIEAFYRLPGCGVGGPLHITVEDQNIDDHSLDFCRATLAGGTIAATYHAEGKTPERDALGTAILDGLAALTEPERFVVCSIHWGDRYVAPGRTRTFSYPASVELVGDDAGDWELHRIGEYHP